MYFVVGKAWRLQSSNTKKALRFAEAGGCELAKHVNIK